MNASGSAGGGGEYDVQTGFGWTNGVVIDFMVTFGDEVRNRAVVVAQLKVRTLLLLEFLGSNPALLKLSLDSHLFST